MSKTANGLLKHCKNAKNWMYVYGAKGTVLSRSQIQDLRNIYGSAVWESDLNKAGKICCDCSGLISSYTGIIRSSQNFADTALASAGISQLKSDWKKYVGWGIWMKGHIGVVSDTVGYYYAMDGSARNWAHRPLADNGWVKVIKLKDIDYSENIKVNKNPDIIYALKRKSTGTWYPAVTNNSDYAGNDGEKFTGFMAKLSDGSVLKYRVHFVNGKWSKWVSGYNAKDVEKGYAGDDTGVIDAVQMKSGRHSISYCSSSTKNGNKYYPAVNDEEADYAGVKGQPLDKIMCWVVD